MIPELDALPPGEAVFDMVGTLIDGDISESVMALREAAGSLPAHVVAALGPGWSAYRALAPVERARVCGEALRGASLAELESHVDTAFAQRRVRVRPAVAELAAWVALRHRVWVLSGSEERVVRAAAARVGIPRVMGLRLAAEGVEEPLPADEGKVRVVWWRLGRRPVFAIGDSPWDQPILALARVARTTGRIAGQVHPAFPP